MEANVCDINRLDTDDVLLPPRKRLLVDLKKQNSDGNSCMSSTSSLLNEYDDRLDKLLRTHLNSNDSLSEEEIVEASISAAEAAVKVASAARAAADEKAIIAATAMAAAKEALDLVAKGPLKALPNERYFKKKNLKKQVRVQVLYSNNDKNPRVENRTDEELARNMHRAINNSPKISKPPPPSELKDNKHKRLKTIPDSSPSPATGISQQVA